MSNTMPIVFVIMTCFTAAIVSLGVMGLCAYLGLLDERIAMIIGALGVLMAIVAGRREST